jgi:hypothetical protein
MKATFAYTYLPYTVHVLVYREVRSIGYWTFQMVGGAVRMSIGSSHTHETRNCEWSTHETSISSVLILDSSMHDCFHCIRSANTVVNTVHVDK